MRVLLVEDDATLHQRVKTALSQAGFAIDVAENGVDAQYMGEAGAYDAIVLDLGLPGRSGLEVLRAWRDRGNPVPVLILTARDTWHERVDGLRAGADDYLGKPFALEELIARLNALIRRSKGHVSGELSVGGLTLDEDRQAVRREDGTPVALTGMEFRLLRYFMLHPGQVLSKMRLADHVYDWEADPESNVLEVYIKRLRQKCGKDIIHTRRGQGYVFLTPSAP
jgi:two-component system, OmpR family, response regulator